MESQADQLRNKIQSKMTVATFLAGFTFAALLELIKDRSLFDSTQGSAYFLLPIRVAVISLTLALALFISAVYMYDRMTMPEAFWLYEPRSNPLSNGYKRPIRWLSNQLILLHLKIIPQSDRAADKLLYTYMIWTWKYVFTPAVVFALIGFCAILYNLQDTSIFYLALIAVCLILVFYIVSRPRLGID
jgi:type III secretory pathway component EscS